MTHTKLFRLAVERVAALEGITFTAALRWPTYAISDRVQDAGAAEEVVLAARTRPAAGLLAAVRAFAAASGAKRWELFTRPNYITLWGVRWWYSGVEWCGLYWLHAGPVHLQAGGTRRGMEVATGPEWEACRREMAALGDELAEAWELTRPDMLPGEG